MKTERAHDECQHEQREINTIPIRHRSSSFQLVNEAQRNARRLRPPGTLRWRLRDLPDLIRVAREMIRCRRASFCMAHACHGKSIGASDVLGRRTDPDATASSADVCGRNEKVFVFAGLAGSRRVGPAGGEGRRRLQAIRL
jgi:hypothetical protein